MADDVKLDACPFCGADDNIPGHLPQWRVWSIDCECGVTMTGETKEGIIASWNRRAPSIGHREALRSMLEEIQRVNRTWAGTDWSYYRAGNVATKALELLAALPPSEGAYTELYAAAVRYIETSNGNSTPYIKENGRHGKSPWVELREAVDAVASFSPPTGP